MNKKLISLVLGIMCFILTIGICVQIKTVNNLNTSVGSSYEENNLRAEVLKYREKYENKYKELEKAQKTLEKEREDSTQNNEQLEEMESQIKIGNKLIGLTEVKGPGVIVTLNDGKLKQGTVYMGSLSDLLVHDVDVLSVINELKNAGAEAISINDQRVVPNTSISCGGNIIDINGEKVGVPFVIKAIGLPEYLSGISRVGGCLNILKEKYNVSTDLKTSNNIVIPAYTGVINFNYAKSID